MPDELTDQIHQRVAEKSATLCDLGVLMEKAAESISSDDLGIGVDEARERSERAGLIQGTVSPVRIELILVLGEDVA